MVFMRLSLFDKRWVIATQAACEHEATGPGVARTIKVFCLSCQLHVTCLNSAPVLVEYIKLVAKRTYFSGLQSKSRFLGVYGIAHANRLFVICSAMAVKSCIAVCANVSTFSKVLCETR
ncbi:unnamed protein product [Ostreobium quekettii]|uniref:Uncharacterized protein n=1 Tax=Ostreobium quekettii TaxID=121088 RepID=A0A8S1ITL6_9CHLO|nr:unnamed protein product [Ostreobium quekettii]